MQQSYVWFSYVFFMNDLRSTPPHINPKRLNSKRLAVPIYRLEEMKCPGPLRSIPTCADGSVVRNGLSYCQLPSGGIMAIWKIPELKG